MDRSIANTYKVIAEAYGDSDEVDLMDSVTSHARATLDLERLYGLSVQSGSILAGNLRSVPPELGWLTLRGNALGVAGPHDRYRAYVGQIDGYRLLVGESFAESEEIARLALTSLAWASFAILVLVTATGVWVAVQAQRRIDGIALIMAKVGHGELDSRIPVGKRADDIDLLARQVNAALDRLSGLVEGMRQVSVNIAHDLKTPLNRLAIMIETAIKADAEGASTAVLLAEADLEIRQTSATFDALLRIAQIEAGARRARFVPTGIGAVLGRIADAYEDVAEGRGQHLRIARCGQLPAIEGDADLLTQLCANLVENSMRHCPAGTTVCIEAVQRGKRIVVTFSDDGPGIPEQERGKVFQRLYRVDKSRTTPGSGLGLSLVKAIADLHGGEITIGDNAPGLRIAVAFPARTSGP